MTSSFSCDIFGMPSTKQIFTQAASAFFPKWVLEYITDHSSNPRLARARDAKKTVTDIARELVQERSDELLQGKGNRDVFTLLGGFLSNFPEILIHVVDAYLTVKANLGANAKNQMSDEELLAQVW